MESAPVASEAAAAEVGAVDSPGPAAGEAGEAAAPGAVRRFRVLQHLHLGLNLRINAAYSEEELRRRCGSDVPKLAKLEKAMQNPRMLAIVMGDAQGVKASAGDRRRSSTGSTPGESPKKGKKRVLAPSAGGEPPPPKRLPWQPMFLSGQVVWDMSDTPPRPAKVADIEREREATPYRVRFLDEAGKRAGEEGEVYRSEAALQAVDVKDFMRSSRRRPSCPGAASPAASMAPSEGASSLASPPGRLAGTPWRADEAGKQQRAAEVPRRRPDVRARPEALPTPGQVVWVSDRGRPSWPGLVLPPVAEGTASGLFRVRLLGAAAGRDEGAVVVDVLAEDGFLPFVRGDASRLASVAEEAEALHVEALLAGPSPPLAPPAGAAGASSEPRDKAPQAAAAGAEAAASAEPIIKAELAAPAKTAAPAEEAAPP